jgi:hypothetical protein
MAWTNIIQSISARASANVTTLTLDSNGNYSSGGIPQGVCVMVDVPDGTTGAVTWATTGLLPLGVANTAPAAAKGQAVQVVTQGTMRIKAHSAITVGDIVYVGATDGTIATVTADGATSVYIVGVALESAAEAGDFIAVQLQIGSQHVTA